MVADLSDLTEDVSSGKAWVFMQERCQNLCSAPEGGNASALFCS